MTEAGTKGTVGPIIFADETARQQLEEVGEVVTFRKSERTTGDTWWRKSRLGPKEGDVQVNELEKVNPQRSEDLEPHRKLSGFSSVTAWQRAIRTVNGSLPDEGVLYHVTLNES